MSESVQNWSPPRPEDHESQLEWVYRFGPLIRPGFTNAGNAAGGVAEFEVAQAWVAQQRQERS